MGSGRIVFLGVTALAIYLGYKIKCALGPPPLVTLENDTYWGPGEPNNAWKENFLITPLNITVPDEVLEYLKWRLDTHRPMVPPLEGVQQQYGMNTKLLEDVIQYWKTEYNWTERQQYLNKYPQYKINIQGLQIHVVHRNSYADGYKVVPILLLHGWPGSVREFYEMIPYLTNPQEGRKVIFEVLAPYIPGYGFSQAAAKPGLGAAQMAVLFKNMMEKLGYDKFYVQGGDFGAIILQHMAVMYPDSILGFHSNMCLVHTPKALLRLMLGTIFPSWYVRPDHYDRVYPLREKVFEFYLRESGYFHLQATKPDTLGVGMNDSPMGIAAYILEKFVTGTNISWQLREDGGLKEAFSYRDLLDNIMIYWLTQSATTSFRLYSETFNKAHTELGFMRQPITVPTACARFKYDFYTADGVLGEIFTNLLQLTDHEGGHFAAFQLPKVLADDIYDAVEKFEEYNKKRKSIMNGDVWKNA
ncbi:hypothetical protein NQ317_012802 [Molorchus minor]|uniref:Epoxide hydrolase n=1 Tax=Molorchus minor TaxID=1323400 RepID=A0ABQ9K3H0_9CUCU|nr:hypothetical protein NQ317_012802 [Molorchus minor]